MSWYYKMGGVTQGPIEREALIDLLRAGTLMPQVEVSEDEQNWLIAPQVPGLMDEVHGKPTGSTVAPQGPGSAQAQASAPAPAQSTAMPGPPAAAAPAPAPVQHAVSSDLPGPPPVAAESDQPAAPTPTPSGAAPTPVSPQPTAPVPPTGSASSPATDIPGPNNPAPAPASSAEPGMPPGPGANSFGNGTTISGPLGPMVPPSQNTSAPASPDAPDQAPAGGDNQPAEGAEVSAASSQPSPLAQGLSPSSAIAALKAAPLSFGEPGPAEEPSDEQGGPEVAGPPTPTPGAPSLFIAAPTGAPPDVAGADPELEAKADTGGNGPEPAKEEQAPNLSFAIAAPAGGPTPVVESAKPISEEEPEAEPKAGATKQDGPAPEVKPSGPVGQIVFDPAARAKSKSKREGGGIAKLAICGVLGLAALLAAGFFTATKVFGIDLRPASINRDVSKFMVEDLDVVAHVDLEEILESEAFKQASSTSSLTSNPAFSYIKDAEDVIVVSNDLSGGTPSFLAIVTLKRDYRAEFIANFFREGTTETVGTYQMHTDPNALGGVAACLPGPRTLLIGSPYTVKSVLERDRHPRLYPRESELIAATKKDNKGVRVGLFFDYFEGIVTDLQDKMDDQMKQLSGDQRRAMKEMMGGDLGKMADDLVYAVKNIRYMTIDLQFTDKISVNTVAECGSKGKAKKITRILKGFMTDSPMAAGLASQLNNAIPVANGSTIQASSSFDVDELPGGLTAGRPAAW